MRARNHNVLVFIQRICVLHNRGQGTDACTPDPDRRSQWHESALNSVDIKPATMINNLLKYSYVGAVTSKPLNKISEVRKY